MIEKDGFLKFLPSNNSPIKEDLSPFPFTYSLNRFIPLGRAAKGRYHVALFYKAPLGKDAYILDNPFVYASYCYELPITDKGGLVIGSLFVADASRVRLGVYKFWVGTLGKHDLIGFPVASETKGTHAFVSDDGVLFIPAFMHDAPFIIKDEKD